MVLQNLLTKRYSDPETTSKLIQLIDQATINHHLNYEELDFLITHCSTEELDYLKQQANTIRHQHYGNTVYLRGLIEISNYCVQNCNYCGIRMKNRLVKRYRLSKEEILKCVATGVDLNYHTFVLQGGEDLYFTDHVLCDIIKTIKARYPDVALTLSIGERSQESYSLLHKAGADRYLLRHETADKGLYSQLHPPTMSFENRRRCLDELRTIGFQVGCGFMVNSPHQSNQDLAKDFLYIQQFQPDMCGIGPYISHSQTPLAGCENGQLQQIEFCVALTRILLPKVLLPATTALATISALGREAVLDSGANVVMPNLSPVANRSNYEIYEGKVATGDEAAQSHANIERKINAAGYQIDMQIGHVKGWNDVY